MNYIRKKFVKLNANAGKTIYVHQTCATDTNKVCIFLNLIIDGIIKVLMFISKVFCLFKFSCNSNCHKFLILMEF